MEFYVQVATYIPIHNTVVIKLILLMQVQPCCRPTAKEFLQMEFYGDPCNVKYTNAITKQRCYRYTAT